MKMEQQKKNGEKARTVLLMIWWKFLLRLSETDGASKSLKERIENGDD